MRLGQKIFLFCVASTIALLITMEIVLRFCGYPSGVFAPLVPSTGGLYPASITMPMTWGPIQYTVKTNSMGFRGEEIRPEKKPNTLRIVTIGDSMTDGWFVDNDATWQYFLQATLGQKLGKPVEVVTCARGAGSIDWESYILKRFGLPLKPDIVILTFCTNDIADILDIPITKLHEMEYQTFEPTPVLAITRFLLTRTAIGEAVVDGYLRVRSPSYRESRKRESSSYRVGDARYQIEGGKEYGRNTEKFLRQMSKTDGIVLQGSFNESVRKALVNYEILLSEVDSACKQHDARLLFVFIPAYAQIYQPDASLLINETLRSMCGRLKVDFLDLTRGFREKGFDQPLHLAPVDYHLTPYGNRVFASLVGERLSRDEQLAAKSLK